MHLTGSKYYWDDENVKYWAWTRNQIYISSIATQCDSHYTTDARFYHYAYILVCPLA